MSPERIEFDHPIVRIATDKIRFPRKCPVCGAAATEVTRVTVVPGRKQYLRSTWDPAYNPALRKQMGMSLPETRMLLIPVCEDHLYSDEDYYRYKMLCVIVDGLSMVMLTFALLTLGGNLWRGVSSDAWIYGAIAFGVASFAISITAFRPKPIESAVKIVGFDGGLQNIWLDFKNREYRDEFMKENPMTAELVSWVVRSRRKVGRTGALRYRSI